MSMSAKTKRRITHAYMNENLRKYLKVRKIWPAKITIFVNARGYFKFKKAKNV